jgi:perosamine synthetase
MIVTQDAQLAEDLRRLRHQGMSLSDYARHSARPTEFETYPEIGYNARLTDIQAAIGLVQLSRTEELLGARRRVAEIYNAHFSNHELLKPPYVPKYLEHNWQSYQVTLKKNVALGRNEIMERLFNAGVPTRRGVMATHLEAPYRMNGATLPYTEWVAANSLLLPMHSGMSDSQARFVLSEIDRLLE